MGKQNRARTRAIRQRMATTGETYTQAARTASTTPHTSTHKSDRLGLILTTLLTQWKNSREREEARIEQEESAGRRIVDGGQTYGDSWEIIDWRSGRVIEQGEDGHDGYERATERLDPDDTWVHVDQLQMEEIWAHPRPDPIPGIPSDLVEIIDEWLHTAPRAEVAALIGWSEQEVTEHLQDLGVVREIR